MNWTMINITLQPSLSPQSRTNWFECELILYCIEWIVTINHDLQLRPCYRSPPLDFLDTFVCAYICVGVFVCVCAEGESHEE